MAHADSYNKHNIRNVLKEHNRTLDKYKNDVDHNRTHLNWGYGLANDTVDKMQVATMARCADIMQGKQMQEQTNVLSEWVVTYPVDECTSVKYDTGKVDKKTGKPIIKKYNKPKDMEHCKKFFDTAYKFACDRYGEENVIAGFVHMDETTPQIHIDIVPEAVSRKTGKKTVSSASLLSKSELKQFHKDLQAEMNSVFGKNNYILNGRTKGDYTLGELKQRTKDFEYVAKYNRYNKKREEALNARESDLQSREQALQAEQVKLQEEQQRLSRERTGLLQLKSELEERSAKEDKREADFQVREDQLEAQRRAIKETAEKVKRKAVAEADKIIEQRISAYDSVEKRAMTEWSKRLKNREIPTIGTEDFTDLFDRHFDK